MQRIGEIHHSDEESKCQDQIQSARNPQSLSPRREQNYADEEIEESKEPQGEAQRQGDFIFDQTRQ